MVTPRSGGSRRDDSGQARPIWRCAARRPSRSRCAANDHAHVAAWDKLPWGRPSSPVGDAQTRSRGAVVARCHLSEQTQGRPPRIISRGHPCPRARCIARPPRRETPARAPAASRARRAARPLPALTPVRAPAAPRNPCRCARCIARPLHRAPAVSPDPCPRAASRNLRPRCPLSARPPRRATPAGSSNEAGAPRTSRRRSHPHRCRCSRRLASTADPASCACHPPAGR